MTPSSEGVNGVRVLKKIANNVNNTLILSIIPEKIPKTKNKTILIIKYNLVSFLIEIASSR